MKRVLATAFAAFAACITAPTLASEPLTSCVHDPAAHGMPERMQGLREQIDRIELTADQDQRRILMDLHMKKMHEGMRTLRERGAGEACRLEFTQAMLEQVMRHQLAQHPDTR